MACDGVEVRCCLSGDHGGPCVLDDEPQHCACRAALDAKDYHESQHCGVLWCRDCGRLFDDLQAAIRAASPWTGGALCWCRSDDAPDCQTPSCVALRSLLARPEAGASRSRQP